jgi:3',5'-cyclic-AMP phosphodiesterase
MPVTLLPFSRRRFIKGALAAGAGLALRPWEALAEQAKVDPNRIALLADTHINANKAYRHQTGIQQYEHLQEVNRQIIAARPRPACAIVNGDCAHLKGLSEDYTTLVEGVAPLREAGLPLHFALGNHDDRPNFWKALPSDAREQALADRHITVVSLPHANLFVLDSLDLVDVTPGLLGQAQRDWLARALDQRPDKPAILIIHHQLDRRAKISGLVDGEDLLKVVVPRRQVKAWIFGHTHVWQHDREQGLHMLNLPPVAYVFATDRPSGWVDAEFGPDGATFTLRTIDPAHRLNGEKRELTWR